MLKNIIASQHVLQVVRQWPDIWLTLAVLQGIKNKNNNGG